ncbi:MAG TPA: protein kinase [Streptosporangiaceae bacterium]|nr:protein kinase [Streptosporangiaceae bacterium]
MTAPAHDGLIAGRYQLVAPIDSGGTATVYRGLDTLLDLEVAVKQLTPAPAADAGLHAEAIERIVREAQAAARIHHPGVAEIYDVVSGEDSPYIVMQLIEGRPLAELIAEQGPLPPHRVAGIGRQVLAALVAGHVVGVLHQNLEPGNVMITPDGQAVLTAFGTAGTAGTGGTAGDPPVPRTGTVPGHPGYLAPERANGMPATPATDLWSLGATLYAALCGQGPFDDRDGALATLSAIAGEDPPHLAGDGSLYEIVNALLRRDPASRPAFHEIARALDAAAANAPAEETPPPAPPGFGREPDTPPEVTAAPVPAFVPPSPGAHARHGEGGTARTDRRARVSLILTAVAGLALVAAAVAVFVPGTSHSAQAPPAPARSSPAPARSSPATARSSPGLTGPPPVGQQFRVAAAANPDGSPEVVARAGNGTLIAARAAKGSWSAWTALPGGPAYTGDPAVATAKDGRLIVFARAVTGQVAEIWQTSPGSASWQGPVPLGTTITHSSPAAVTWPDGHLEVFALLSDAHVGYVSQSSTSGGGTWTGWSSLGGPVTGPPAVALDATGHPQVFAATAGRLLAHDYYLNGHWAGWVQAPGKARYVGVPGIAADADGRLEVFARSTNGDLLHLWQLPGTGIRWGGPGRLAENGCSTDPAVFSGINDEHGGHLEAFCMDSKFGLSVFHTVQLSPKPGTPWSPWQSLKGSSDGAVTALQTPTITGILARTASGVLAYATWTTRHGWSSWSMLPRSS